MKDNGKREQIITAYLDACEQYGDDDIGLSFAANENELPDVTRAEIATAINVYAERARKEADIFTRWSEKQRRAGRPESEITWGKCVDALNLWRPNTTN